MPFATAALLRAWPALEEHAPSLLAILKAWDDDGGGCGKCSLPDFRRAVLALGALGRLPELPSEATLAAAFDCLAAPGEALVLSELVQLGISWYAARCAAAEVVEAAEAVGKD